MPDHPKVAAAGPIAAWLNVCGIAYCNRQLTDGYIPASVANRLTDADEAGCYTCEEIAERLCEVGLWERVEGGYRIHDYLVYQPSKEAVLKEREAARSRMNKRRSSGEVRANIGRSSASPHPNPSLEVQKQRVSKNQKLSPTISSNLEEAKSGASVKRVYDHWRQARGKTRSNYQTISPARRQKIQARLREFSEADLLAAIDAVARDPWPDRGLHDDLTVIFRSREQVERFLELPAVGSSNGNGGGKVPVDREQWLRVAREIEARVGAA